MPKVYRAKLDPVGAVGFSPRSTNLTSNWALALVFFCPERKAQG